MATPRPLFPSAQPTDEEDEPIERNKSWLTNTSYQPIPIPAHEHLAPPPKKTKEHKEKERRRETVKQERSTTPAPKPKTNWFDDCGLAPQEAYRLDPSSDRANLQYSALYSGDIAAYRRRFGGQCLGLGPHQTIEWTDNRGTKHARKHREKVTRYFTTSLPQNDSCLYLASCQETTDVTVTPQRRSHAPFFMALESAASVSRDAGEEEKMDGISRELTSEVFVSQQTAKYNRALQDDPHNVGLWLEFLEFQPAVRVSGGGEGAVGKMATSKALRAVNERKLAVFERALEHNPMSENLLIGHLELLREVGREPDTLLKRWKDLLFRMPNKPLLWLKYTEFCRMQFSTFSLSSVTTLYQKSFTTLTAIVEGVMKSHSLEPNTTEHLLALFTQHCHCLSAAGQNERAIACYQALIEYNLCPPSDISPTRSATNKQKINFFEPFWDSGAPRLGEDGAIGWSQWMQVTQTQLKARPLSLIDAHSLAHSEVSTADDGEQCDPELSLIAGHTLPEAWLLLESYRQKMEALPFRGSEDELSDPERAVLFEDISQCMFTVNDKHLQLKLVLQYLEFLAGVMSYSGAPCLDNLPHLLSPHLHCALDALPSSLPRVDTSFSYSVLHPHSYCGVSAGCDFLSTADLLQPVSKAKHPPPSHTMCCFISNTCNQLLSLLPCPEMQTAVALEWVQFELSLLLPALLDPDQGNSRDTRRRGKAVQKLVKSLLKLECHRNNLCLWDCCAQLELLLAGSGEAQTLYETVLSQYVTVTPQLFPLYQHYCEVLMGLTAPISAASLPLQPQSVSRALQLTACVAEGKFSKPCDTVPPSNVLRARHVYEQKPLLERTSSYVICHAYFEYLSRGIGSACKVFDDHTSAKLNLPTPSSPEEQRALLLVLHCVHYHQIHLLVHHAQSSPMPPTLLLNALERALTRYPNDPFFLLVYTDCQQPLYLMGKLRKYFDTQAPGAETVLPWIHAVRAEVARYKRVREGEMEGSTDIPAGLVNRIRALLNRATQSVNGRGCPLLWRLAISFEVEQNRVSEAKALFYQAIQYCPGEKVLYWDAVRFFPDELQRIVEVMEERELRIRAPLEEVQMLMDATTQLSQHVQTST